jgi:protein SCO1/2
MSRIPLIVTTVVVLLAGVGVVAIGLARRSPEPVTESGRSFNLTDHRGRPFTDRDLHGTLTLLYFGYTFCPDVCPTELGYLARLIRALGPQGDQVRPVMITIDPERDTAQMLAGFVEVFDPRMIGLTGTPEAIRTLAKAYGVFAQRANVVTAKPGFYLMDHTSTTFVLDRQGRQVLKIDSHTTPVETAAAQVRGLL